MLDCSGISTGAFSSIGANSRHCSGVSPTGIINSAVEPIETFKVTVTFGMGDTLYSLSQSRVKRFLTKKSSNSKPVNTSTIQARYMPFMISIRNQVFGN